MLLKWMKWRSSRSFIEQKTLHVEWIQGDRDDFDEEE